MQPIFLPDVEANPKPSPYADLIRASKEAGSETSQIWHLFAFKPEMTTHLARLSEAVMRAPAPLSPGLRELIAAYTSALNECPFCTKSHIGFAAALLRRERGGDAFELVHGVIRDLETSGLEEKEKVLFRFVRKVHFQAQQITEEDMTPLREAGWTDEAIYYAITVCALFNFYNRWVGASGVHAMSEEANRLYGERSAETGYIRKS